MNTITSRRHTVRFYITLFLGFAFLLALGAFMIYLFIKDHSQGSVKSSAYLMPAFGVLVILLGLYTVYRYFKNTPKIEINGILISFNEQVFALSDIEKIEFTGKHSFPYIINYPMEAAALYFKDGSRKLIFDDMYENAWQLKLFLKHVVIDKKEPAIEAFTPVHPSELSNEFYDTFKNNQFLSLRGISLWSIIGMLLWPIFNNNKKVNLALFVFVPALGAFWLAVHA